jgi:hypothetical protein
VVVEALEGMSYNSLYITHDSTVYRIGALAVISTRGKTEVYYEARRSGSRD